MTEYIDVRDVHPDYKRADCPECGVERLFKQSTWDDTPVAICQTCNARETLDIEIACPDCERRMTYDGPADEWRCQTCEGTRAADRDELIDRMTELGDLRVGYVLGEPCPRCKAPRGVHGDPDATLKCRECDGLYIGQYSDEWWAYAEWLLHRGRSGRYEPPTWIRNNLRGEA